MREREGGGGDDRGEVILIFCPNTKKAKSFIRRKGKEGEGEFPPQVKIILTFSPILPYMVCTG